MSDVEAPDWLDRLLSADEVRATRHVIVGGDQSRIARASRRMLSGALSSEPTSLIAAPILAGFARVLGRDTFAGVRRCAQPDISTKRELGQGACRWSGWPSAPTAW